MIRKRVLPALLAAFAVTAGVLSGPVAATADETIGDPYPGDPAAEAEIAGNEDARIAEIVRLAATYRWSSYEGAPPVQLTTEDRPTTVLPPRGQPYSLSELADLAPEAVSKEGEGEYLISSHLVVDKGATLRIASEDGATIRMASNGEGFSSIVSIGGNLEFSGGDKKPLAFTSNNADGKADTRTEDGRAYIRAVGGSVAIDNAEFTHLGFWSGHTGGLALTGSEAPEIRTASDELVAGPGATPGVEIESGVPVHLLDDEEDDGGGVVKAKLTDVTSKHNAYGLFATNVGSLEASGGEYSDNLVDGVVLHRFVSGAELTDIDARGNGMHGIRAARGSTDMTVKKAAVSGNGYNGITVQAGPLADGPSATGASTGGFGGHTVTDSKVLNNGHYGIQVVGGSRVALHDNTVTVHRSGIVVNGRADGMSIKGNNVRASQEQGIALRDDITGSAIRANTIEGGEIGIYTRGSASDIVDNTVKDQTNHGIAVIDQPERSTVTDNTVSGSGPAAIDTSRSGIKVSAVGNDTEGWHVTKPLAVHLQRIFQPLTVLWLLLATILVLSAIPRRRARRTGRKKTHPYSSHTPLSELTAGVVPPESLGIESAPWSARIGRAGRRRAGPPEAAAAPSTRGT